MCPHAFHCMLLCNIDHYKLSTLWKILFQGIIPIIFSWKNSCIISIKYVLTVSEEATKVVLLHPQEYTSIGSYFFLQENAKIKRNLEEKKCQNNIYTSPPPPAHPNHQNQCHFPGYLNIHGISLLFSTDSQAYAKY